MTALASLYPCHASDAFIRPKGRTDPDPSLWHGAGWRIGLTPGTAECTWSNDEYHLQTKPHYRDFALLVKARYPGTVSANYPRVVVRAPETWSSNPHYGYSFGLYTDAGSANLECIYWTASAPPVARVSAPCPVNNKGWHQLRVDASGSFMTAAVNDTWRLTISSNLYPSGSVELVAANAPAQFRDFVLYDPSTKVDFLVTEYTPKASPSAWGGGGSAQIELSCKALGPSVDELWSFLEDRLLRAQGVVAMTPAGTWSGYIAHVHDGLRRKGGAQLADLNITLDIMDVRE
jgi:hypothetical protein